MNLFTTGLGEPMTSDVEMQRPNDLQAAMSLARAFEHHARAATRVPYRARPTVSTMGSTATSTPATPTNSSKSHFHRLSPEEMAEKRKRGECYFCPENFFHGS
jgi:hypothetical protein